ncbi:MAG: hypothetical protein KAR20_17530, partial [Candidatus Heimdallarchaeota archaeon]|nr:hypothetical protein [Candidatus Heimdallarchaeota archaeon]
QSILNKPAWNDNYQIWKGIYFFAYNEQNQKKAQPTKKTPTPARNIPKLAKSSTVFFTSH